MFQLTCVPVLWDVVFIFCSSVFIWYQVSDISFARLNRLSSILKSFSWSQNWQHQSQEIRSAQRLGRPRLRMSALALNTAALRSTQTVAMSLTAYSIGHRLILPLSWVNWPAVVYVTQTLDTQPNCATLFFPKCEYSGIRRWHNGYDTGTISRRHSQHTTKHTQNNRQTVHWTETRNL